MNSNSGYNSPRAPSPNSSSAPPTQASSDANFTPQNAAPSSSDSPQKATASSTAPSRNYKASANTFANSSPRSPAPTPSILLGANQQTEAARTRRRPSMAALSARGGPEGGPGAI